MDLKTPEEIQELDLWRCREAETLGRKSGFSVFWHYRTLVREDVRPNPVSSVPFAVEQTEKTIRYEMETMSAGLFLECLKVNLANLYDCGVVAGLGMVDGISRLPVAEEGFKDCDPTSGQVADKSDAVHPIRRHIAAIREKRACSRSPMPDSGLGPEPRDWREV